MEHELEQLGTQVEEITTGIEEVIPVLPTWVMPVAVLVVAFLAGLIVFRLAFGILNRMVAQKDLFWRSLVARTRRPLRLGLLVAALTVGVAVAPLSPEGTQLGRHALLIAFMVLVGWTVHTALQIWTTVHLRKFTLDSEDNYLARKHVTQSRILVRMAGWMIVIIATAAILMTFDGVRQWGVSLLAAGGAAGIVVGLAFQPVLKNMIAGIQLAITQPIRIDDAVIVEGEWGWIEEITGTYVVIKIWDWRRLVVPLSYFIEQPFQNWTRDTSSLIGNVLLYLDHTTDIARLREAARKAVESSELWDGEVFVVQVNDFREREMEVRILASARSAPRTYDLRCEIREKLVTWIQKEMPQALPRTRETVSVDGTGRPLPPEIQEINGRV
ncbi:hypothetical protein GCM10011415_03600 [Salipiger pallidus]|uniref:Mechanosensitive ion channel MscS domain-containing protein n=1 Tax=Salipiger pallidus TaxID=1775170 RepID=A0A8J2ZGU2_9RHOB|nr:mechanosensitive ion channel family protein [Salipiger pallidus]GGG60882.1 hypothetical protein GCM10011415_03600 [Salipiger pallidus]